MNYYSGKTVLLTGAAGRLGAELARRLVARGARLILTDRDPRALTRMAREAASAAGENPGMVHSGFAGDLSTPAGRELCYHTYTKIASHVDILIITAGLSAHGPGQEMRPDTLYARIQADLRAPMHLASLFFQDMAARRAGHIVIVAPVAGFAHGYRDVLYSCARAALRAMGTNLRGALKRRGTAVTIACPFLADAGSAENAAEKTLRGIAKRKARVNPGPCAWIARRAGVLWPFKAIHR